MSLLEKALALAVDAHRGQKDRERLNRYLAAYRRLREALNKGGLAVFAG